MGEDLLEVRIAAPDKASGDALARLLVTERLAACCQVLGPMTSVYRWEDEVRTAEEHLLLAKTTARLFAALEERVRAEHPYDVPEVLAVPVGAVSEPYAGWLAAAFRRA